MDNIDKQLAGILSHNWWKLLLRGLVAIAFGVMCWLLPAISFAVLVLLFGAYALVDGLIGIWIAIAGRAEHEQRWLLLLWGLLGAGIGILTFLKPNITALVLMYYIAIWAITAGFIEILAAIRLRKEIKGEWRLILGGLLSLLFGLLLIVWPGGGALSMLWVIATFAFVFGILLIMLAFKVRKLG